jgi:diguanylate cyclase (GGDEF)-like protein/PAS domain S-box-containing protein
MNTASDAPTPRIDDPSVPLTEIVDHLDAMVAYWDADRRCVFANAAYRDWFGKTPEQILGHTLQDLLGPLYAKNLPYIDAAYRGEKQVFEREIPLPGGGVRSSLATYTPRKVDGRVVGIFVHVADVGPLKRAQEELRLAREQAEKQAAHDPLTGLPNRLLLLETIARALAAARRTHEHVALFSIDIDRFKAVNDTYGHAAGDALLVELAARLRHSLRGSDTVFRVGGDEFVALLPDIGSAAQAQALARRVLQAARATVETGGSLVTPSVSVGIALHPGQGGTAEALLLAADRALYEAKHQGRDTLAVST